MHIKEVGTEMNKAAAAAAKYAAAVFEKAEKQVGKGTRSVSTEEIAQASEALHAAHEGG